MGKRKNLLTSDDTRRHNHVAVAYSSTWVFDILVDPLSLSFSQKRHSTRCAGINELRPCQFSASGPYPRSQGRNLLLKQTSPILKQKPRSRLQTTSDFGVPATADACMMWYPLQNSFGSNRIDQSPIDKGLNQPYVFENVLLVLVVCVLKLAFVDQRMSMM